MVIHSPDTSTLVICLRRYDACQSHGVIDLGSIASALGSAKLAAMFAFNAPIGVDITVRSIEKGKLAFWKAF